ncbi:MAG TPA: hypothetical protein VH120_07770, partial [Gemmataceae bacterium]|nr:hypothetical protein [Gemmataceae bacterium]
LILGGNPVFTAPADVNFRKCLDKVPLRIHLNQYEDETSRLCHWHVPEAHFLEAWGDARTFDGTATIMQPLIAPLYGGRSALEVLAVFGDQPTQPGQDVVPNTGGGTTAISGSTSRSTAGGGGACTTGSCLAPPCPRGT